MTDYLADYRDKLAAGVTLREIAEPAADYDPGIGLVPFTGAQVGWSPARESGRSGEVEVIAPDGQLATLEGVCSECSWNHGSRDPITGNRICLGCGRGGR